MENHTVKQLWLKKLKTTEKTMTLLIAKAKAYYYTNKKKYKKDHVNSIEIFYTMKKVEKNYANNRNKCSCSGPSAFKRGSCRLRFS